MQLHSVSIAQANRQKEEPRKGEVSLARAQEIAQSFATKAGFPVRVASLRHQFMDHGQPSRYNETLDDNQRSWYLGSPEISFKVSASTGRMIEFRRTNRADDGLRKAQAGAFSSTRSNLASHAKAAARKLGLFDPVRVQVFGIYDDNGRARNPGSNSVWLYGSRRVVHLAFHKQEGDLVLYIDRPDGASISKRDALKPQRGDRTLDEAVRSVSLALSMLGKAPIKSADSIGTLHRLAGTPRLWRIQHPNWRAEVDSRTGQVMRLGPATLDRLFRPGDRRIVRNSSEAARFLRALASKVGVPSQASLSARIQDEMVFHYGWIGLVRGDFRWGSKTCHIRCDLSSGELVILDFLPARTRKHVLGDPSSHRPKSEPPGARPNSPSAAGKAPNKSGGSSR